MKNADELQLLRWLVIDSRQERCIFFVPFERGYRAKPVFSTSFLSLPCESPDESPTHLSKRFYSAALT